MGTIITGCVVFGAIAWILWNLFKPKKGKVGCFGGCSNCSCGATGKKNNPH